MEYAQPMKPLKPPERQLSASETPRPTPASAQPRYSVLYRYFKLVFVRLRTVMNCGL